MPVEDPKKEKLTKEMQGMALGTVGVFFLLSFVTYNAADVSWNSYSNEGIIHNLGGRLGAQVADLFFSSFGLASYLIPLALLYMAYTLFRFKEIRLRSYKLLASGGLIFSLSTLFAFFRDTTILFGQQVATGGAVGKWTCNLLKNTVGATGAMLLLLPLLAASIMILSKFSFVLFAGWWLDNFKHKWAAWQEPARAEKALRDAEKRQCVVVLRRSQRFARVRREPFRQARRGCRLLRARRAVEKSLRRALREIRADELFVRVQHRRDHRIHHMRELEIGEVDFVRAPHRRREVTVPAAAIRRRRSLGAGEQFLFVKTRVPSRRARPQRPSSPSPWRSFSTTSCPEIDITRHRSPPQAAPSSVRTRSGPARSSTTAAPLPADRATRPDRRGISAHAEAAASPSPDSRVGATGDAAPHASPATSEKSQTPRNSRRPHTAASTPGGRRAPGLLEKAGRA